MKQETLNKWIRDLRKTNVRQCVGAPFVYNKNGEVEGYCALGRLAIINGIDQNKMFEDKLRYIKECFADGHHIEANDDDHTFTYMGRTDDELRGCHVARIENWNDKDLLTFSQIADKLESSKQDFIY